MKFNTLIVIGLLNLLLFGCGFGTDKENREVANSNEQIEDSGNPAEPESWQGWQAPARLGDLSLTYFGADAFAGSGLHSAQANYKAGETFLNVLVVDGRSEKGRNEIRQHLEIADREINSESAFGYEKTVTRPGIRAREEYLKAAGQYLVRFIHSDHYGVTVKSNTASAEALWAHIDALNLASLR